MGRPEEKHHEGHPPVAGQSRASHQRRRILLQIFRERAAGSAKRGYYSYDVGAWKVIVINSEIVVNPEFPRSDEADQLTWIKNEMKTSTKACTLAYFHHPRFSSGWHGSDPRMAPTWQAMMDGGVDLVLAGHDHHYERLAPMNAEGVRDSVKGIPSFVVGTGGGELRGLQRTMTPNSEYRLQGYFGVLKLTLGDKGYTSAFIDTNARVWDPVAGGCIQNKAPTPTPDHGAAISAKRDLLLGTVALLGHVDELHGERQVAVADHRVARRVEMDHDATGQGWVDVALEPDRPFSPPSRSVTRTRRIPDRSKVTTLSTPAWVRTSMVRITYS